MGQAGEEKRIGKNKTGRLIRNFSTAVLGKSCISKTGFEFQELGKFVGIFLLVLLSPQPVAAVVRKGSRACVHDLDLGPQEEMRLGEAALLPSARAEAGMGGANMNNELLHLLAKLWGVV